MQIILRDGSDIHMSEEETQTPPLDLDPPSMEDDIPGITGSIDDLGESAEILNRLSLEKTVQ